ncbi:hypothetical protein NMD63_05690 [Edwardsiella tarda]|uniref:DUF6950 family protein n=1 Tax=Edwardsiella tarda TaxID=636 RepID=UPI00351C6F49
MNYQGFITEYLSSLIGTEIVYSQNDCHIMALTVIDIMLGTHYADEIRGKYNTPKEGRAYAVKNCSYLTLEALCESIGTEVSEPNDGDILIAKDHCTVFWRGKILVLNDDVWGITRINSFNDYKIYRIRRN